MRPYEFVVVKTESGSLPADFVSLHDPEGVGLYGDLLKWGVAKVDQLVALHDPECVGLWCLLK